MACGALVVSDCVSGMHDLLNDFVSIYDDTPDGLKEQVTYLLNERKDFSQRRSDAQRRMAELHTFDHRVSLILKIVFSLDSRPALPEISY